MELWKKLTRLVRRDARDVSDQVRPASGVAPQASLNVEFSSETPKWHSNLVLVCEKCGKKLDRERAVSLELKDALKKKLIGLGKWGPVRVVTSSCLDLCPEGKVAVGFTGDSGLSSEVMAVDPVADREMILQEILDRADEASAEKGKKK